MKTSKSNKELEKARQIIYEKYTTVTPTNKISTVKAQHLYSFISRCFYYGVDNEKTLDLPSAKRRLKQLKELGFDEDYLEKWHKIYKQENPPKKVEVIPIVLDFSQQTPDWYEPPKSKYSGDFDEYLNKSHLKFIE